MTAPADIRTGLVEALTPLHAAAKAAGYNGMQVSGYWLSSPTPPAIWCIPDKTEYDLTGSRGTDGWTWTLQAVVALTLEKSAQMYLDLLLASSGALSVKAAVEADPTLGGVVGDVRVIEGLGNQIFDVPSKGVMLGSSWTVEMLASG
jgi:hypothetical protein